MIGKKIITTGCFLIAILLFSCCGTCERNRQWEDEIKRRTDSLLKELEKPLNVNDTISGGFFYESKN